MPDPASTTFPIELPAGFIHACSTLNIDPQTALQQFIDQLSVYVHFTTADNTRRSMASSIFKAFVDQRGTTPPPDEARELHIHSIQQLLHLIRSGLRPQRKEELYKKLADTWYQQLIKMK